MKYLVAGVVLLAAVYPAQASYFTEEWTNYNTGYTITGVTYSPVDGTVAVGESHNSSLTTHVFNASDGTPASPFPAKLPTTGLTSPWLGFFGTIQASANGKYFGNLSQPDGTGTIGDLAVWNSLTDAAPTQTFLNASFSRNMHVIGDRIYSVGDGDGGSIQIAEPNAGTGEWDVAYTLGTPGSQTAAPFGGKADVAAMADGSMVWGVDGTTSSTDDRNGFHQWSYDAGSDTWSYDGTIHALYRVGVGRCTGVGVDDDDGLLFALDHDNSQIVAIKLNSATVGDEWLVDTWPLDPAQANAWIYGSVRVDGANNELYWGTRDQDSTGTGHFGKLSYVPEPSALALLVLGGLAVLRRR
jgi:hypothetical protein